MPVHERYGQETIPASICINGFAYEPRQIWLKCEIPSVKAI